MFGCSLFPYRCIDVKVSWLICLLTLKMTDVSIGCWRKHRGIFDYYNELRLFKEKLEIKFRKKLEILFVFLNFFFFQI